MLGNGLKIGSGYRLAYNTPWTDMELKDIIVVGVTTEPAVNKAYADFDLFNTYFTPYKLGLSTYVSMVSPTTTIYVCNEIEKRDPISQKDDPILIPSTLIDFNNTIEYVFSEHIDISISGLSKKFDLVYERGEYIRELKSELHKKLSELEKIGDIPLNINLLLKEFIQRSDEAEAIERQKVEKFNIVKKADIANRVRDDEYLRNLKDKLKTLRLTQSDYDRRILELEDIKNEFESNRDDMIANNTYLNSIKDSITDLFSGLEDGSITIDTSQGSAYANLKSDILDGMP